jgi:hypothetical protein
MGDVIDISKSRIFNDLVEYTQLSRNLVLQKCADAEKELALLWKGKKNVIEFYQNTDLYLFDLTKYQLILEYQNKIKEMIKQIKELKLKKILEYGGGIGEFSLLCFEDDLDTSYYDLDGKTKDYALWRFKKHNCYINIEKPGCLDKEWDIVNIMDVFEHLENPEEIIAKLKKNARYIFCNPNEIKYNELCPQHISKFDLTKDFEQIKEYLWKNKYLS